jgi:hypothetical protein
VAQLIYDASPSRREVDAPPPRKPSKDDERDFVSALVASSLEFWTSGERDKLSASVEVPRTGKTDLASVLVDSTIQELHQRSKFLARLPQVLKMANELGNKLIGAPSLDDLKKLVAPPTIINGSISSERSYAAVTLPMSRMKAFRAACFASTFSGKTRSLKSRLRRSCRYLSEKQATRPRATRSWA